MTASCKVTSFGHFNIRMLVSSTIACLSFPCSGRRLCHSSYSTIAEARVRSESICVIICQCCAIGLKGRIAVFDSLLSQLRGRSGAM